VDGGRVLAWERPLRRRGQLDPEEGVGVRDRLRNRARNAFLEQGAARGPVEAGHGGHERGQRTRVIAASVRREDRSCLLEEGLAIRKREQQQLQEDQRVHGLGLVERELDGDRRAARVARDVSPRHAEMPEQRRGIGRVVADAHRRRRVGTAGPTPLVVADQLAAGKRRF
jgi:hypothetical protein